MSHAVMTGPISGTVTLADGTSVDVSAPLVYLDTVERAVEVAALIGRHYAEAGHPSHQIDQPFTYVPED